MFKNLFGTLFDFNRDGEMDVFECAAELQFLVEIVMSGDEGEDADFDTDSFEDSEDF